MRWFRVSEFVLGFLFATGICVIVFILQIDQAAHYQICETNQYTGKEQCASHHLLYVVVWYLSYLINSTSLTAAATIAIAYFTLNLKRSTDNLWDASDKHLRHAKEIADRQATEIQDQLRIARDAATAAKKSADAAVATERARFYVVIEANFLECINLAAAWDGGYPEEKEILPMNVQPMAGIRFTNYGKTPGIVIDVSTGIVYSEEIPDPVYVEKVVMENIIAPGKQTEKFGTLIAGLINMRQAKKVRSGEGTIWVFGKIGYEDVFGERQIHRFFHRVVCVSEFRYVLQAYDHKHYNRST